MTGYDYAPTPDRAAYFPEGVLLDQPENRAALSNAAALVQAAADGRILEARAVLCDAAHNLHVSLPCMEGLIPREEGAAGIGEGITPDIALISRVSKPVCFTVTGFETLPDGRQRALLSRRRAQQQCMERYIRHLRPGDVIPARITRLESFGAFCDIGCGLPALIPIAGISVSRIAHPADRLQTGMSVFGVVSSTENGRVCLSIRELLGTWEENAALFSPHETVSGIVRSVEDYGIFVEIAPNLAGLAEPYPGAHPGQRAGVYIKSILPERMKIKLILVSVDETPAAPEPTPLHYFLTDAPIARWRYSPAACERVIESVFESADVPDAVPDDTPAEGDAPVDTADSDTAAVDTAALFPSADSPAFAAPLRTGLFHKLKTK